MVNGHRDCLHDTFLLSSSLYIVPASADGATRYEILDLGMRCTRPRGEHYEMSSALLSSALTFVLAVLRGGIGPTFSSQKKANFQLGASAEGRPSNLVFERCPLSVGQSSLLRAGSNAAAPHCLVEMML